MLSSTHTRNSLAISTRSWPETLFKKLDRHKAQPEAIQQAKQEAFYQALQKTF
jgi:hypothetical protein